MITVIFFGNPEHGPEGFNEKKSNLSMRTIATDHLKKYMDDDDVVPDNL